MKRGIYIASKTKHAAKWIALRNQGYPIISTWIDEAAAGASDSYEDLWHRCITEASSAKYLISYIEEGEILKGGLAEIGAALAVGTEVFLVGMNDQFRTLKFHENITQVNDLDDALRRCM